LDPTKRVNHYPSISLVKSAVVREPRPTNWSQISPLTSQAGARHRVRSKKSRTQNCKLRKPAIFTAMSKTPSQGAPPGKTRRPRKVGCYAGYQHTIIKMRVRHTFSGHDGRHFIRLV
jgi:hypothetical protein